MLCNLHLSYAGGSKLPSELFHQQCCLLEYSGWCHTGLVACPKFVKESHICNQAITESPLQLNSGAESDQHRHWILINPQQPNSQWFAPGTVQVARRERELQCLGFWGSWIRNPWMITKVSYSFIFGYFWRMQSKRRMQSSSATDERRLSIWCATSLGMSCPSWLWHRTGSSWSPIWTLPVAPLWCDLRFIPNSRGNKAAVNLRPTVPRQTR